MENKIDIISVKLNTCHDVKNFVAVANTLNGQIFASQFEYIINGKSLLGVMSLDTDFPITVKIIDCADNEVEKFNQWKN